MIFWVFSLGIVLSVSHNTASLGATKTLDRIYEPVVATAGDMQVLDFYGEPVSGFKAFRYDAATFGWEEVPVQVDQRHYRNFGSLIECTNGFPECACTNPPTCGVCEYTYVWDGETDPDDGTVLDANDEIVFLAKDTGDEAPSNDAPGGMMTVPRYRLQVGHPESGYGWLYLYATSSQPAAGDYVQWSDNGETGAARQTTFKVCDHPRLAGFDGYQIGIRGHWSINELRVDAAGTTEGCNVTYSTIDLVDRVKWRMGGESDELWNATSTYLGRRDGVVRDMFGSIGAASRYGTTHTYKFYPTWFEDEVHLRVHKLNNAVLGYIDWLRAATNQGTQVCPVQNFDFFRTGYGQVQDYVDGGCAPSFSGDAFEGRPLNGPYVSLVELFWQDPQHPVPSRTTSMYYADNAAAPLETGRESEQGAYGNVGVRFSNPNSTEERSCSEVKFAGFKRIWQVKRDDSLQDRAVTLNDDLAASLQITSLAECPGCGGSTPPPTTPCKPSLTVNDPGVGYFSDLSVGSPCGTDGLWFQAYRSVGTSGPFEPLTSLGIATAFKDYRVERGQTYRYYVESYNADGTTSEASDVKTVTVTDTTAPTPVTIVGSASGSQGSLGWEWTDDYDLVGYHIYRATQSGGPYTKLTLGGPVEQKDYSVQLVPQGTTYYFVVKAVDEAGLESTVSNEVALTNE